MFNNELSKRFETYTGIKFESFYRKYRPKLVFHLNKYTKDSEISEDFADDAFTQTLLKIDKYDKEKSQIHTWIFKIAENLVKKDFKDKNRMTVFSIDKENDENLSTKSRITNSKDDTTDIETQFIVSKKAELIEKAIYSLPEKYKRVMIMRELMNKPYLEIAELCSKEINFNIRNQIHDLKSIAEYSKIVVKNTGKDILKIKLSDYSSNVIEYKIKPEGEITFPDLNAFNIAEVGSTDVFDITYHIPTNLSTIKSQILKGRQLIHDIVINEFKYIENFVDVEIDDFE